MFDPEISTLLEFFNLSVTGICLNIHSGSLNLMLTRPGGDRWTGHASKNGSTEDSLLSALCDALTQYSVHWRREAEHLLPFIILDAEIPNAIPGRFSLKNLRVSSYDSGASVSAVVSLQDAEKVLAPEVQGGKNIPEAIIGALNKASGCDGKLLRCRHQGELVWIQVQIQGQAFVGKGSAEPCLVQGIAAAYIQILNQYSLQNCRKAEKTDPVTGEVLEVLA